MTVALRVLVADDEPLTRSELVSLVQSEAGLELVAVCRDGKEAFERLGQADVDLALLDVEMPLMSGIEVVRSLGSAAPPAVVFATAHPEFAVAAFEVQAIDYLLKPYDHARFAAALGRVRERLASRDGTSTGTRLVLRREGRVEVVMVQDLLWVESADQYVQLHTTDGERLMRESMSRMEEALLPHGFLRVHRSAIVRLEQVRELHSLPGGAKELLLGDGSRVPVSRARAAEVRRNLL
jgi:two-component system LytT family response regulator